MRDSSSAVNNPGQYDFGVTVYQKEFLFRGFINNGSTETGAEVYRCLPFRVTD